LVQFSTVSNVFISISGVTVFSDELSLIDTGRYVLIDPGHSESQPSRFKEDFAWVLRDPRIGGWGGRVSVQDLNSV